MFQVLEVVELARDLPEFGLVAGIPGTVVRVYVEDGCQFQKTAALFAGDLWVNAVVF